MADRIRWEYKAIELSWQGRMSGPPMSEMNRLGGDGWEVATYLPFPDGAKESGKACGWLVLKRPKG